MKFAIINDIHHGPKNSGYLHDIQRKLTSESLRKVDEFVTKVNGQTDLSFVVNLGDSIEDVNDRETDIHLFTSVVDRLSTLSIPCYYLVGNHDIRTLTEQEIAQILGYEKMYYSFDHSDYHFIALSFQITGEHTKVLKDISALVSTNQLHWLEDDLASTTKDVVVFEHYGLADDDMKDNFWFEEEPHYALISNRKDVRKILEDSGKVRAVFNAHQHWNRMNIHNSIPYFTVTSLIENTNNDGVPAEAHTVVYLSKNTVHVQVIGKDPAEFSYTV